MTTDDLAALLDEYRSGLEAELRLLEQLEAVATRQHHGTQARDFERLAAESDERDRLTQSLMTIEQGLSSVRNVLSARRAETEAIEGYSGVAALRQTAIERVARILATDRHAVQALSNAELARRAALATIERGGTTLAAYRKVLTPPVAAAGLVDRRA